MGKTSTANKLKSYHKLAKERKEKGWCYKCGSPKRHPGIMTCLKCRDKRRSINNENLKSGWKASRKMFVASEQGHRCAICKEECNDLQGDHCHKSKKTRALLCRHCNFGLGNFRDNPAFLRLAAEYVEKDWTQ